MELPRGVIHFSLLSLAFFSVFFSFFLVISLRDGVTFAGIEGASLVVMGHESVVLYDVGFRVSWFGMVMGLGRVWDIMKVHIEGIEDAGLWLMRWNLTRSRCNV